MWNRAWAKRGFSELCPEALLTVAVAVPCLYAALFHEGSHTSPFACLTTAQGSLRGCEDLRGITVLHTLIHVLLTIYL
jgi:hypothetical protein